jgi:hypothetical protein
LKQGGPREVINHKDGDEGVKTSSIVTFKVKQYPANASFGFLMNLIPDNTLLGSVDEVPGVSG